jgi:septin 7
MSMRSLSSVVPIAVPIPILQDPSSSPIPLGTSTAAIARVVTPDRDRAALAVKELRLSKTNAFFSSAANGSMLPPPDRASPLPDPAQMNGKPSSPLVSTSNTVHNGGTTAPQTVTSKDPKAAAQAASDMRNIVRRKLTGYVGFANLPNQWHRKSVRKGFNFNVMVVGEYNVVVKERERERRRKRGRRADELA